MLSLNDPTTAIFCSNDMLAYGCLQELADQQVKIPQEISVMGANNFIVSSITNPPLTTIDLPAYQMGKAATEFLIDKIQGIEKNNLTIELTPSLVVRNSVQKREE